MCSENTAFPVWYSHDRTCNNLLIFLNTRRIIKLRSCRHPSVKSKGQSPAWKTDCAICGGELCLHLAETLYPPRGAGFPSAASNPADTSTTSGENSWAMGITTDLWRHNRTGCSDLTPALLLLLLLDGWSTSSKENPVVCPRASLLYYSVAYCHKNTFQRNGTEFSVPYW